MKKALSLILAVTLLFGITPPKLITTVIAEKVRYDYTKVALSPFDTDVVMFNDHYYTVFDGSTIGDYSDCVAYCESQEGYMATITSDEENNFLFNYIRSLGLGSVYFGLSDDGHTGEWTWVNGETSNYRNWHPGEPSNNVNTLEHWAQFYSGFNDGTWNDGAFCTGNTWYDTRYFICEWGDYESGSECSGYHNWDIDRNYNCFVCTDCGCHQSYSPQLGYVFGRDNFSFEHDEIASYDISLAGYYCMIPIIKLSTVALRLRLGREWTGSCFGVSAMNSSFFSGMSTADFGASEPSMLSVSNANGFFLNNDTKLKDAINIMFFSQTVPNFAQFFQGSTFRDVVEAARNLNYGDYPPIICFTGRDENNEEFNHAVSIIGIEPDDFAEEFYVITTNDSNNTHVPSLIMVKKDFSAVLFSYMARDNNWHYVRIDSIVSFITSSMYNIDLFAPGLRTSPLYASKELSAESPVEEDFLAPTYSEKCTKDSEEFISFIIPNDTSVTITSPSGRILSTDINGNYSSEIDPVTVTPFIGTELIILSLPYESGEYTLSCEQSFFANINYNQNSASIVAESGCDIVYSANGTFSYTPYVANEYIKAGYYRYGILGNSDAMGVELQGNVSNQVSVICEGENIYLYGENITEQSIFVQHDDYEMTNEELSFELDDNTGSIVISDTDDGIIVTPGEDESLLGDANSDGTVNVNDALLILRHAMGLITLPESIILYCDVNGDGNIDVSDALLVLRVAMGLIVIN